MNAQTIMNQYKTVGLKSGVDSASPHQLIDMLLKGAMGKISEAKAAMAGGQIALKGEAVGKAIAIVEYLRVRWTPVLMRPFQSSWASCIVISRLGFWRRTLKTIQRR